MKFIGSTYNYSEYKAIFSWRVWTLQLLYYSFGGKIGCIESLSLLWQYHSVVRGQFAKFLVSMPTSTTVMRRKKVLSFLNSMDYISGHMGGNLLCHVHKFLDIQKSQMYAQNLICKKNRNFWHFAQKFL